MTYPIRFDGLPWLDADRAAVDEALALVGAKLAQITGGEPEEAFRCLFGELTLEAVDRCPGGWDAYVEAGVPDRIQFTRGKVTARLVVHELGHIVNDRDKS